ncbi:MAG: hypothetical protein IJX43_03355 [Alphaproteobacteria bacterium]|nr:hypothetical protein [Alphaproteobacteria bacterium]
MKGFILILAIIILVPLSANAACTANAKVYSSCKSGYYMSGTTCTKCISGTYGGGGTSTSCSTCPDHNGLLVATSSAGSSSITNCYIPSSSKMFFSDTTGSGTEKFSSNCYYSN